MLVNDELYFQIFRKLLEAVVKAGGLEIPVEHLQKNHFCLLSRKINLKSGIKYGIQPSTFRDYRYIYKQEKKFSIRQNRLDLMCEFLGYDGWNEFKKAQFQFSEIKQGSNAKVRLLVLPDRRVGVVKNFEGQIAELIINRYEELKDELDIDNLEILFEDNFQSDPTGINKIHKLGLSRQADLIIWPEYIHGKHPSMRISVLRVNTENHKAERTKQRYQKAGALVDILDGAFLEQADTMLFHLLGIAAFKKEKPEKARLYFERVLALDPHHSEASYYMNLLRQDHKVLVEETFHLNVPEGLAIDFEASIKVTSDRTNRKTKAKPRILTEERPEALPELSDPTVRSAGPSLKKHLLVLRGDHQVLKSKDLEPLVKSMLIHEDEPIIFLTSHTDISLMSMKDLNIFSLQAKRKEIPIKEALVSFNRIVSQQEISPENKQKPIKWLLFSPQNRFLTST